MIETDVLIIGGGLSGLAIASQLALDGRDFALVEARDRLGGRILTENYGGTRFDMGPAWFWPGQQRIASLIDRLELPRFDQFSTGDLIFEDERGRVQRGRGFSSMQGSYRLTGSFGALIDALKNEVPKDRIFLGQTISSLSYDRKTISGTTSGVSLFQANRVVFALPPRLAATIGFDPELPPDAMRDMKSVATWMAGQAKATAVYDRPFWRENGLSGDAMSRFGPMVEIHDASPAQGGPYALFGFIGVPPQVRKEQTLLKKQILAQLERIFGPEASAPQAMFVKDWATDMRTSTRDDSKPLFAHPQYEILPNLHSLWDGKLLFSGTETAKQFGGYLEGALEAADNAVAALRLTTS